MPPNVEKPVWVIKKKRSLLGMLGCCLIRLLTVPVWLTAAQSVNFLLSFVDGQLQDLKWCEIRRLPAICSICLPAYNKCCSHPGPSAVQRLICPIPSVPFKDVFPGLLHGQNFLHLTAVEWWIMNRCESSSTAGQARGLHSICTPLSLLPCRLAPLVRLLSQGTLRAVLDCRLKL